MDEPRTDICTGPASEGHRGAPRGRRGSWSTHPPRPKIGGGPPAGCVRGTRRRGLNGASRHGASKRLDNHAPFVVDLEAVRPERARTVEAVERMHAKITRARPQGRPCAPRAAHRRARGPRRAGRSPHGRVILRVAGERLKRVEQELVVVGGRVEVARKAALGGRVENFCDEMKDSSIARIATSTSSSRTCSRRCMRARASAMRMRLSMWRTAMNTPPPRATRGAARRRRSDLGLVDARELRRAVLAGVRDVLLEELLRDELELVVVALGLARRRRRRGEEAAAPPAPPLPSSPPAETPAPPPPPPAAAAPPPLAASSSREPSPPRTGRARRCEPTTKLAEHLIRDRIDLVFEHAEHVEALEDRVRERHVLREG